MKVPLLDLKAQYRSIKKEIISATSEIFDSQMFILGPKVAEFEAQAAEYCGCSYSVGVSSGTDALLLSLMAAGIGNGDIVITTPYTFFATAGVISRVGATPMFVDIEEDTFNMDPVLLNETIRSMDDSQLKKIKAVIPIHLFGQCADMSPILKTSRKFNLTVIEDAAQAIGAEYAFDDGSFKRAGSMGHYGCFSFFPSKNLGAFGDAGMVTTNNEDTYELLKTMRVHGSKPKYYHSMIGGNFRIDAIQAAVLRVKLKYLDKWSAKRMENAALYRGLFEQKGVDEVSVPVEKQKRHIYNQFVIRVKEDRNRLKDFLTDNGVGCEIYYPVPLHMQDCFSDLKNLPEGFPVALKASKTSLALPIYAELEESQIKYVVDKIKEFYSKNNK